MVMAMLTEREAIRERLRNYALAHALDHHMMARCRWANENGVPQADHGCSRPADSRICLCPCHDGPAGDQKPPAP